MIIVHVRSMRDGFPTLIRTYDGEIKWGKLNRGLEKSIQLYNTFKPTDWYKIKLCLKKEKCRASSLVKK